MAQNESALQIVEFTDGTLRFLDVAPAAAPDDGFVWISLERPDFDAQLPHIQAAAERLGGSMLLDVHLQDLASDVQPTVYDATSIYDLVIFRRLATLEEVAYAAGHQEKDEPAPNFAAELTRAFRRIDSRAVGFAVFDKLLVSVHPPACLTATSYVQRFLADIKLSVNAADAAGATTSVTAVRARVPQSPADLVLRLINSMVDSYLGLRKDLSQTMERAQTELLKPAPAPSIWNALILARYRLQMLQDLCEEQQDAMQEWHDTLRDLPLSAYGATSGAAQGQRDQLIARARDVMEHIDRVVHHARRLEQTAETGMQIHFSTQNQRTNAVMQTLTAVTAIFLPLNFFTGFFGMNFEHLPLIHSAAGMWLTLVVMFGMAWGLLIYFLRRRFLEK
ncbi:MAG: magnesium transporter CorA family protein [Burkholderiaceae bacterium]|jgi:Mg2+ and Co2+ transporter CorA|nr:magnesium transporter CorA family protein [Burkholderiaceae bacterium]